MMDVTIHNGDLLAPGLGTIPPSTRVNLVIDPNTPTPLISVTGQIRTPSIILFNAHTNAGKTVAAQCLIYHLLPRFHLVLVYSQNDDSERWHLIQPNPKLRFKSIGDGKELEKFLEKIRVARDEMFDRYTEAGIDTDSFEGFLRYPFGQILIVLDDQAAEQHFHTAHAITTLATRGRHLGITTLVTSQKPTLIMNTLRMNAQYVFFTNPDKPASQMLYKDYGSASLDTVKEFRDLASRFSTNRQMLIYNRFGSNASNRLSDTYMYWRAAPVSKEAWLDLRRSIDEHQRNWLTSFYEKTEPKSLELMKEIDEQLAVERVEFGEELDSDMEIISASEEEIEEEEEEAGSNGIFSFFN